MRDKRPYVPITSRSFEAKISIDIQQTFFFFVTMLASLRTNFFLPTFYVFFRAISKKRKSHVFLKSEKNEKYVFSNTGFMVSQLLSVAKFVAYAISLKHEKSHNHVQCTSLSFQYVHLQLKTDSNNSILGNIQASLLHTAVSQVPLQITRTTVSCAFLLC